MMTTEEVGYLKEIAKLEEVRDNWIMDWRIERDQRVALEYDIKWYRDNVSKLKNSFWERLKFLFRGELV